MLPILNKRACLEVNSALIVNGKSYLPLPHEGLEGGDDLVDRSYQVFVGFDVNLELALLDGHPLNLRAVVEVNHLSRHPNVVQEA